MNDKEKLKKKQNNISDKERINREKHSNLWIVRISVVFTVFTIAFYFIWFGLISNQNLSIKTADWGTFGDFVGGFGSTLLALVTIVLIYKSIQTQLFEFSRLSDLHQKQNIDSRFFNLLNLHNNLIKEVRGSVKNQIYKGDQYLHNLLCYYKEIETDVNQVKVDLGKRKISLLHIINNLSAMIEFLKVKEDTGLLEPEEVEEYLEVMRTQLNSNELLILAYLVRNVSQNNYNILESNQIFKYLDTEDHLSEKDRIVINDLLVK
ncbi:hypothetical protein [Winogradskyella luteola]|uniref:Phage abortive infection protein n=1 Tax=Winogradskyella luteola TaxID=2828330 RepID=A0A9X1JTJ8_9FLAO|nr:hypothetical protein [Winogradskyella luteola]MBV7270697.1 hypothetical protein [Winogradskyella luteola]